MIVDYTQRHGDKWFGTATPVNAVKASTSITIDTQVTADDTMTIGDKVYTFVADGTEANDGDISVGTDLATCQENIVKAINGTDTINEANMYAAAGDFNTDDSIVTALIVGDEQNTIATTSSFTTGTNKFATTTLINGRYATQTGTSSFWIAPNGTWYISETGVDKWSMDGWKSAVPS